MQGQDIRDYEAQQTAMATPRAEQPPALPPGVQGPPQAPVDPFGPREEAIGGLEGGVYKSQALAQLGGQREEYQAGQRTRAQQLQDLANQRTQGMEDYETQLRLKKEYALPTAPKTIKTTEGVFILNTDGTLGTRLGGAKADTEIFMGGELKKGFRPVVDPVTGETTGAEFIPGGSEDPTVIQASKEAEKKAIRTAENVKMMPARRGDIMTKIERFPALKKAISDVKELSRGFMTSGVTGQVLSNIAGTDQYALEAKLQTVKSAVGLEELIRVKAAGGTFGALSDTEMTLLISAVGALDGNLPPDQLGPVLDEVERLYSKGLERKKSDFAEMYPDVRRPWESQTNVQSGAPISVIPNNQIQGFGNLPPAPPGFE